MFHLLRHKPRGLSKSTVITIISVISNYAAAMMTLIIPLYLFAIFKSEEVVGQISSISTLVWIIGTISLWFLLSHFSRSILFKAWMIIRFASIFIFFTIAYFTEALVAKILFALAWVIVPSVLSLYLRDLTTPEDLPHKQWVYSAVVNIAWLTWPMVAWFLLEYFWNNYSSIITNFPILSQLSEEFFKYVATFAIALLLFAISLTIFVWNKFVVKHPHLEETEKSKETNKAHHHSQLANIKEYFHDEKRALSFINISFISIWWVFIFTFFSILLEQHGVSEEMIWILVGLISLPNVLFEWFIWWIDKKVWWSTNALILGYLIFFIIVVLAFVVWMDNIYLFAWLIILSQIWVAITEPLQELQYFEWTNESNDWKFYTIHKIGGDVFYLITPLFIWAWITAFWIDAVFKTIPYTFIPLFVVLYFVKRRFRNSKL